MALYRIYFLKADDHISGTVAPHEAECASDRDAVGVAAKVIGAHPAVEIWNGSRVVGRFTAAECRLL